MIDAYRVAISGGLAGHYLRDVAPLAAILVAVLTLTVLTLTVLTVTVLTVRRGSSSR